MRSGPVQEAHSVVRHKHTATHVHCQGTYEAVMPFRGGTMHSLAQWECRVCAVKAIWQGFKEEVARVLGLKG